jgi:signal transduction histidine kinase
LTRLDALRAGVEPASDAAGYAFEHAHLWMAAATPDLIIVAANAAWRRGFGADAAIGRALGEFLSQSVMASFAAGERPDAPPLILVGDLTLEVRLDRSGDLVMAVLADVTVRAAAEAAQKAAKRARGYLLDAAGVAGVHYDPDTDTNTLTEEFAEIFGAGVTFTTEELHRATPPQDSVRLREAAERVFTRGVAEDLEVRSANADGGWKRLRVLMRPGRRLPSGRFEVFSLSQDVTALAEARDRAQAKARQLDLALRAANAGVFEIDFVNRTVDCSPGFVRMVGRDFTFEEATIATPIFETPDLEAFEAMRETWGDGRTLEMRIVREGEERWVRIYSDVLRDPDGSRLHSVGLMLDIDDAKRQELALQAAQAAAEAATEAKSRFLASMSHEIRTPMNGVVGVLHLLKNEPVSDDGRRLLDEALVCSDMLSQLINDVLDFSKIEAGKLEIAPEPSSTRAALEGVIALLRSQAEAKGIELRGEVEPGLDWAMVDPVRLRQCLFNLVGNAVKFTDSGEVVTRLSRAGPGRLRLEVADTGPGVPLEARSRLFQRFEQVDGPNGRAFGGTGLGLAITRNLVELMDGKIGVHGNDPQGSVFWLEIAAPPAAAPAAEAELGAEASLEGLRVLLVDDNRTNRLIGAKVLEALGAAPVLAEDGAQAIEAVRREPLDLVLMDINMPVMDGLEAVRHIRSLPGGVGDLPVLALTANVMAHQRESYLAAGMDGVVGKPFSPAELLREVLEAARVQQVRLSKAS